MKHNTVSQKERKIYESVISLMRSGSDFYKIKVADIAKEAGIGKGTVYEYFETKEEIIVKAILYSLNAECGHIREKMLEQSTFRSMFYAMAECTKKNIEENFPVFEIFLSSGAAAQVMRYVCGQGEETQQIFAEIKEIVQIFLEKGVEEGIIVLDEEDTYVFTVIISVLKGYIGSINNKFFPMDWQTAADHSYTLLIKALS